MKSVKAINKETGEIEILTGCFEKYGRRNFTYKGCPKNSGILVEFIVNGESIYEKMNTEQNRYFLNKQAELARREAICEYNERFQ